MTDNHLLHFVNTKMKKNTKPPLKIKGLHSIHDRKKKVSTAVPLKKG